jgi:sensor histidine kinase YesM
MKIDRKFIKRQGRDLLIFLLVSCIQVYFVCVSCTTFRHYGFSIAFTFLTWTLLWKGNAAISELIATKISWIKRPITCFVVGIISTVTYTASVIVSLMMIFQATFDIRLSERTLYGAYITIGGTIVVSLFLHGRQFLIHLTQATVEREKYEKESISAKYESLKNQVNPHFLFNSLNALTNLVYEDQDKAAKFIKQLSEIYRYVLDTREKEVVSLEEELKFLESYIFLQQIRFGEKLRFSVSVKNSKALITPLALQLLIENAIKHNIIAEDMPLDIKLYEEDNFVCVENNLQKKSAIRDLSPGLGLENIRKRYQILTERRVDIIEDQHIFKVRLPMLTDNGR